MEILIMIWFLIVGIVGSAYPLLDTIVSNLDTKEKVKFNKSDLMYCDGDNT